MQREWHRSVPHFFEGGQSHAFILYPCQGRSFTKNLRTMAGKLRVESPGAIYQVNTPEIAPASNLPIAAVVYGSNIFVYHWTGEGSVPRIYPFPRL